MTEQELREKIVELLWDEHHREYYFDRGNAEKETDKILAFVKEAGYVQLADKQRLPPNPYMDVTSTQPGWQQGIEDILKEAGGRYPK